MREGARLTEPQEVVKLHPDAKLFSRNYRAGIALGHGSLEHELGRGLHAEDEGYACAARLCGRR